MKWINLLVVIVTLGAISTVVLWEAEERTSPGPLHPVHSSVAALAGSEGCARCHGQPGSDAMADACAGCHEEIAVQVARGDGLHGGVDDVAQCGSCHVEHHGAEIAPVGDHTFARAGIATADAYDHRHAEVFALEGAHAELACARCHEHADVAVLPEGSHRFLGLDQSCTSCHEDVHRGEMGPDCARCHGQVKPFPQVGEFDHRRFVLDGAHGPLRCDACHAKDTPHAIDALEGRDVEPRRCVDCHDTPHDPGGSTLPIASAGADCARCHDTRSFARSFDAAAHAAAGTRLVGAHADAECATCHTTERAAEPPNALAMERCADCHESPHRDAFTRALVELAGTDAADCARCHAAEHPRFAPAQLDTELHTATGFALAPPHADVGCAECHGEPTQSAFAARFPGRAPDDCAACHEDPHRGQFDAGPTRGVCVRCHERTHFLPSSFGLDRHADCGFVVDGAHRAVACARCHEAPTGDASRRFAGTPSDCAACHVDVHRGAFDSEGVPHAIGGRTGCARCHGTDSFRDELPGFDHERFTGFGLDGAHTRADCTACHGRAAEPDAHGRTLGAAPRACAACHEDPHAGQFATREGERFVPADCARCHGETEWGDTKRFDHDRDTRFPLDQKHDTLDCARCHRPERTRDGRSVVRYRPLGRECTDCHGGREGRR